ncbi:MAG: class I SAM-dependent methyltransferase [Candidatus Brocadiaceae bacterium]
MAGGERRKLPPEFLDELREVEASYLAHEDPILRSGFSGGAERWRAERSPILEAVDGDGDLLDVGCANGYLLECLVAWAAERGISLTPHGLDVGPRLIALARRRLPRFADNFFVGNAWDWRPPRRFRYVYTLYDCVPENYLAEYVERLLGRVVEPGGRLIVGAYGSRSDNLAPFDVAGFLEGAGYELRGTAIGGRPPVTAFAWLDRPAA